MATGVQFAGVATDLIKLSYTIPYVNNGSSLNGMDCQGLMEFCLNKVGVSKNWKGSNDMWRNALSWKGTPEECKAEFGKIPVGAWLFIVKDDGGEKSKGYNDNEGNASHVGVYTGTGEGAVHASSSKGCVAASSFKGKTIRNGGWNRVGLCKFLDYDVSASADNTRPVSGVSQMNEIMTVYADNGKSVNLRAKPSGTADRLAQLPVGSDVLVTGDSGAWYAVEWEGISGYMMKQFLVKQSTTPAVNTDGDTVNLVLSKSVARELMAAMQSAGVMS